MCKEFDRLRRITGQAVMDKLSAAHVALLGVGGVGGFAAEALARSGIGKVTLIDGDTVALSNMNRQMVALHSTLGQYKAEVARRRMLDINPRMQVNAVTKMFMPDDAAPFDENVDYVIDAIDMVAVKLKIAELCTQMHIPLISCMGTGNKFDPSQLKIADIYKTEVCPLCRVMRRELRKRGIPALKVLYSTESPAQIVDADMTDGSNGRIPGSTMFVPPVAGLMLAREAFMHIAGI